MTTKTNSTTEVPTKLPYEPPRLTRKKSVAKATLFSGNTSIVGGGTP